MPQRRIILSLFDRSGVIARPWIRAGFSALLVDNTHQKGYAGAWPWMTLGVDLSEGWSPPLWLQGQIVFMAAFPPCDHLAISGARWFKGKGLRKLIWSITNFAVAAEIGESLGVPYFLENPVSTIATHWRKPDYTFHPYHYAGYAEDYYTKKTCLWTGGGFVMPPKFYDPDMPVDTKRIHYDSGARREIRRSLTPVGFAEAVFESNHNLTPNINSDIIKET